MPMPLFETEEWREVSFLLLYSQHGGSGLSLTKADLDDMDLGDIMWWVERLGKMREAEAAEMRRIR